jgi:hypothetical protein
VRGAEVGSGDALRDHIGSRAFENAKLLALRGESVERDGLEDEAALERVATLLLETRLGGGGATGGDEAMPATNAMRRRNRRNVKCSCSWGTSSGVPMQQRTKSNIRRISELDAREYPDPYEPSMLVRAA